MARPRKRIETEPAVQSEQRVTRVELLCIYTGTDYSHNAGSQVEVDADEAARLIALGAAKAV